MRSFLLRYPGRIGRSEFWLAFAIAAVVNLVAIFGAIALIAWNVGWFTTGSNTFTFSDGGISFTGGGIKAFTDANEAAAPFVGLASTILWLICLFPASIRRRHDRGAMGWDVLILSILNIAICLAAFWGEIAILKTVMDMVSTLGALYLIVVLGFLRGSREANAFGADPRNETKLESET